MLEELRRGDVYIKMPWRGRRRNGTTEARPGGLAEDVREALDAAGVLDAFLAQPPSHRHERQRFIDEAKRPAARRRRVARTCERLRG